MPSVGLSGRDAFIHFVFTTVQSRNPTLYIVAGVGIALIGVRLGQVYSACPSGT